MKVVIIFTDGGARGNPGPSAIGFVVKDEKGITLYRFAQKIGIATNNEAEYKALLAALDWVIKNQTSFADNTKINFYLDSKLVYSQVTGLYKVKNEKIRQFVFQLRQKEANIQHPVLYNFIPREKNTEADKLVNLALDNLI